MGGGEPLLFNQRHDEFWCHQRQSEHDGEGNETGEAQHLGEDSTQTLDVIAHLDEGWLCHALHHTRDGRGSHRVPLVGLVVSAHLVFVVKFAEHNGEDVVVHTDEDVGEEHLGRKTEHFFDGSEEG